MCSSRGDAGRTDRAKAMKDEGGIDVLVTDVVMPKLSGRALAQRLRDGRPDLAVLFISGYTDAAVIADGEAHTRYLQKPFTADRLLDSVHALTGSRNS